MRWVQRECARVLLHCGRVLAQLTEGQATRVMMLNSSSPGGQDGTGEQRSAEGGRSKAGRGGVLREEGG